MARVLGTYEHSIDSKGRIVIPSPIRLAIGSPCILTTSLDPCLLIYPLDEWEIVEARIRELPELNPKTALLRRRLGGNARQVDVDGQGRINLPLSHRDYACLGEDVITLGVINKAEIWDTATYGKLVKDAQTEDFLLSVRTEFGL